MFLASTSFKDKMINRYTWRWEVLTDYISKDKGLDRNVPDVKVVRSM